MDTKRQLEGEECRIKVQKVLIEYGFVLVPVTTIVNNQVSTSIQMVDAPAEKAPDSTVQIDE